MTARRVRFCAHRRVALAAALRGVFALAAALAMPCVAHAATPAASQPPAPAAPDGLTDDQAVQFLATLQDAVKANDARAVAALTSFPLRVNGGPQVRVPDAAAFIKDYAHIFTPAVRKAVLAQAPGRLFRNWQGAMIGNGEVWFAGLCGDAACKHAHVAITAVTIGK